MIHLASIPSPPENTIELGPLTIHFYGILIALGVITAIVVSRQRFVRFGGSGEFFERVAIWAVVIGFLGARLGYVITHTGRFTDRPWAVLFIWEGGLALYGGLLFGAFAVIYLFNKHEADLFSMADAVAIGIPLAQAIGRFGNYFNQELFGYPTTLPWGLEIDPANRPDGFEQYETFHPTFLYEAVWNALILVPFILWLERRGKLAKGASFGLYIAGYAFIRFWMELLRLDTTFRFLGLSRNGWVSVGAFLFGIGWIWYMQKRAERRTLVGAPTFWCPQPIADSGESTDTGHRTPDTGDEVSIEDEGSDVADEPDPQSPGA